MTSATVTSPVGATAPPAAGALVRPLPPGPLDIVGDIHGEISALDHLMKHLGYNAEGEHVQGRRLVFLGDFVDRGPESAGVMEWVMAMMARGTAFAVMGNHELNLLNGKKADHNAWYFGSNKLELDKLKIDEARRLKLEVFITCRWRWSARTCAWSTPPGTGRRSI